MTINDSKSSYTYYLQRNMDAIEAAAKLSHTEFVAKVEEIIAPAYNSDMKDNFIDRLWALSNSEGMNYINNSIARAARLQARKRGY